MRERRLIMGMPAAVEIVDGQATAADIERVFAYFACVDETFSPYKETSELSRINAGTVQEPSPDMRIVLEACERTSQETGGYFDIRRDGKLDPSGYVKGWAIQNAAELLKSAGFENYLVDVGGDMQAAGLSDKGEPWVIGIRNPLNPGEIIKRVSLLERGMATSGTYLRGQHIYDPHEPDKHLMEILSLTVIGPAIVDADRFATAAFAMGADGIQFIESLEGLEGYQVDAAGTATFTSGFTSYVLS